MNYTITANTDVKSDAERFARAWAEKTVIARAEFMAIARRFGDTPSAANYLAMYTWALALQSLLHCRADRRAALLADLNRTPVNEWPASIGAAAHG